MFIAAFDYSDIQQNLRCTWAWSQNNATLNGSMQQ